MPRTTSARVRTTTLVAALACATAAAPARADLLGAIVNKVMGQFVQALTAPPAPEAPPPGAALQAIPEYAETAVMSPPNGRLVELDGKPARLAPGCQIRDASNRIVMPGSVRERVRVRYVRDASSQLKRVWIVAAR